MQAERRLIWPCPDCRHGRVTLFTSVRPCTRCAESGFVADEPLAVPLCPQSVTVRTRKLLAKGGIYTLGQLACAAAAGRFACVPESSSFFRREVQQLLLSHGMADLVDLIGE